MKDFEVLKYKVGLALAIMPWEMLRTRRSLPLLISMLPKKNMKRPWQLIATTLRLRWGSRAIVINWV
jgi:hypothetical protein